MDVFPEISPLIFTASACILFFVLSLIAVFFKENPASSKSPSSRQKKVDTPPKIILCPKMDCVRCHHSNETRDRALSLFRKYYGAHQSNPALLRIRDSLIDHSDQYIFYMKGLRRLPIWTWREFAPNVALSMDALKFDHWTQFRDEYKRIETFSSNDAENNWSTYPFLNQGDWVSTTANTRVAKILRSTNGIMTGCVFGNAFFSVLKPGASIEPHVGPTNVRIRCHLSIQTPANTSGSLHCTMTVDGVTREWEDSQWLMFDDSFLHSVYYGYDKHHYHPRQLQDRCVMILDLWHPDLTKEEIDCIKKIFPSRLSDSYC